MIKIKDDAIGLMPEYLMNGFPVKLTFLISKKELGQRSLMKSSIFSLEIVKRVDLVTGKILSYDSTLFPTFANYKGCNYACQECRSIPLKDNFLKSLRYRVNNFLNYPEKIILGKEKRFFARCPKDDLSPSVKKRPTFRILSFCFVPKENYQKQSELAHILGLKKRLLEEGLYLKLFSSSISRIDLTRDEPLVYVSCPKVSADPEAKVGYKRANYNPNKKAQVFDYQAMITTNIELEIGLELPVGCACSPADELDGSESFPEREKLI